MLPLTGAGQWFCGLGLNLLGRLANDYCQMAEHTVEESCYSWWEVFFFTKTTRTGPQQVVDFV